MSLVNYSVCMLLVDMRSNTWLWWWAKINKLIVKLFNQVFIFFHHHFSHTYDFLHHLCYLSLMLLLTHCGHLCQLRVDVKWLLLQFHQVLVFSFVESLCTVDKKWTHQDIYSEWIESSQ